MTDEGTSCEDGAVRLEGGLDPASGSVEYCRHRIWGRVCREGWDISDARVVCRQLLFNPEGKHKNYHLCMIADRVDFHQMPR